MEQVFSDYTAIIGERRNSANNLQRRLITVGNMLEHWAGVTPVTKTDLEDLLLVKELWSSVLAEVRGTKAAAPKVNTQALALSILNSSQE